MGTRLTADISMPFDFPGVREENMGWIVLSVNSKDKTLSFYSSGKKKLILSIFSIYHMFSLLNFYRSLASKTLGNVKIAGKKYGKQDM